MWRLLAILCLAAVNMLAAATEIRDTIYTGFSGVLFAGRMTIDAPTMTTADGRTVQRWQQTYTITAGVISVDLEPNSTATPAGTSYYVVYRPTSGLAWSERWVVTVSATPLKVSDVRVTTIPTPTVTFPLTQLSPVGAVKGDLIGFGTSWGTFTGGADGQALLKDSSQPRGLRWGTAGQVSSVFGRTGTVTAGSGDYSAFYAALSHAHLIADVTGLQTALDGKSATAHTHTLTREFTFNLGSTTGLMLGNDDDQKQIWWNNLGSTATITKVGCVSDGATWKELRPLGNVSLDWASIGSDVYGYKFIAAVYDGRVYTSANGGATWTETQPAGNVTKSWKYVGGDGDKLFASPNYGRLYTSANGGVTWTERQPAGDVDKSWNALASNGYTIVAGVNGGRLYISTDSGANWTERRPAGDADKYWHSAATNGSKIVVGGGGFTSGRLYISTDSGATWTERQPAGDVNKYWNAAAIDTNSGVKMAVGVSGGRLYTSTDTGANWTERQPAGAVNKYWGVSSDYYGTHLIARAGAESGDNRLYTSADSGVTWTEVKPRGDVITEWTGILWPYASDTPIAWANGGRIYQYVNSGVPSVNLQRDDGTPVNVLASNLSCSAAGATTTSFVSGENGIADGQKVDFVMSTMGGATRRLTLTGTYTVVQ